MQAIAQAIVFISAVIFGLVTTIAAIFRKN